MPRRTVNVVDTTPPTITLVGANPQTVECHSTYIEAGAVAADACAGDLTSAIGSTLRLSMSTSSAATRSFTP